MRERELLCEGEWPREGRLAAHSKMIRGYNPSKAGIASAQVECPLVSTRVLPHPTGSRRDRSRSALWRCQGAFLCVTIKFATLYSLLLRLVAIALPCRCCCC